MVITRSQVPAIARSPASDDKRISYGCINVPVAFYEKLVMPAFSRTKGIVYVLPEVTAVQTVFKMSSK